MGIVFGVPLLNPHIPGLSCDWEHLGARLKIDTIGHCWWVKVKAMSNRNRADNPPESDPSLFDSKSSAMFPTKTFASSRCLTHMWYCGYRRVEVCPWQVIEIPAPLETNLQGSCWLRG